jgi:S-adenosylmethionine hydrolase
MRSIITLTTDFGLVDGFVGAMKGVILSIVPQVHIVDISHQIPRHCIKAGAWVLWGAQEHFPDGSIHIGVVDPGVGSSRGALVLQTERAFFVSPNNGLLSRVLASEVVIRAHELKEERYWLPRVGNTFHGRDIFAPVAAHIARGVPLEEFGPPMDSPVAFTIPEPRVGERGTMVGQVIYVDGFGNLITNLERSGLGQDREWTILAGDRLIGPIRNAYADADEGELVALWGSQDTLEIAVREGRADQALRCGEGAEVRAAPGPMSPGH